MLDKLMQAVGAITAETANEEAKQVTPEPEKLPDGPSGNGTQYGYQVQARYMFTTPKEFEGLLLDKEWRTVHFPESRVGIPAGGRFELPELMHAGCCSYEAAQALRWWFLANAHADHFSSLCLETRLLEYYIKYEFKAAPKRVLDYVERSGAPRS